MNSLPVQEIKAFSEALEKVHALTDLAEFPTRVFNVVEELIPGVVLTLDEFNLKTGATRNSISREPADFAAWRERLATLVPLEHPVFPTLQAAELEGRDIGAVKISDFVTLREFHRTDLYHDIFKPIGARRQIVLPLRVADHVAGLTISRWEDFSESEFALAQMLAPHIALAHLHAQSFTALRELKQQLSQIQKAPQMDQLTPREAEILHWITEGKRDKEIAIIVGAGVRTIHKHVQRILAKLGVETRTAAAAEARRRLIT